MDELKDKGKRVMENIGERRVDMIQKWEEKSRDFIDAFLLLFGREGRLVSLYISALSSTNFSILKNKIAAM
jgi:choline-phosphate cytidylyltransferase